MVLDPDSLALGFRLGLGYLGDHARCAGYANACPCTECSARAENVAPEFLEWLDREDGPKALPALWRPVEHAPQPWEQAA